MYREGPAGVAGAVLWSSTAPAQPRPVRVLPDGCLDLLWSSRAGLLVAGPDRTAYLNQSAPAEDWVGLRLPPGVGPAVFGIPAVELRDRRVPLADLWGARATRALADRAADAAVSRPAGSPPGGADAAGLGTPGAAGVGAVLVAEAVRRLRACGGPDPLGRRVSAALAAGATVAETAARVGLDARSLLRHSRHLYGYGPKTLARILRMRRALALARSGVSLAEVATRAGYADQAHLTREVRALAGVAPTALLTD
ncbi:helix-turn-helix domain-containing protein [Micromonospora sp. NPDC048871]|uniref:helix-turn-helix domain-containing protein n=1 Tax=unclassified Micromonospora TaxID=2617518 RepID=UPI002E0FBB25|nr:helix-turn-helix domain-containing protein [Micromonospora sp. NBC_01739]